MDRWLKTGTFKVSSGEKREHKKNTNNYTAADVPSSSMSSYAEIPVRRPDDSSTVRENLGVGTRKKRKYDESFIKYGFTWVDNKEEPKAFCVECEEVLSNSSLDPAKLQRHLSTKHPYLKDKSAEYFTRKLAEVQQKKREFCKIFCDDNENALNASYRVSYLIAKAGEAHTIAEKVIKPCAKELVECMIGKKYSNKIECVPLSNNTVSRRIKDMSAYCEKELINRLKLSAAGFSLQMDESTDVAGLSILLVFVRYVHESSIEEDMFICKPLPTNTTGKEIFKMIDSSMREREIYWDLCSSICTDGARAMVGKMAGAVARIKHLAPHVMHNHCCLHRHALAVKRMPQELKDILNEVVRIVNFIKARPLNSRIFTLLCEEMGSLHKTLLLHTEVRWLSRGKVLARFYELRDEIRHFLSENPFELSEKLNDRVWMEKMVYLADIFTYLNETNISLQGINTNIFKVCSKMESLTLKHKTWGECVAKGSLESFPSLNDFILTNNISLEECVKNSICQHLSELRTTITEYFPPQAEKMHWIHTPFVTSSVSTSELSLKEKEQLIDISTDYTLKNKFKEMEITHFWVSLVKEYPEISIRALKVLMPFATSVRDNSICCS